VEISRHRIRSLNRMSSAAREQGNYFVANRCISLMRQLKASSYNIYSCELELDITQAMQEMHHKKKADILAGTLSKFEEYVVSLREQWLQSSSIVGT